MGHTTARNVRTTERVIVELEKLRDAALAHEQSLQDELAHVPGERRHSANNLLHYLAMRQSDIRDLQRDLATLGLSRLGRAEAHTLASVEAVLGAARALMGRAEHRADSRVAVGINGGDLLLRQHAQQLLGDAGRKHPTRIMVTMPGEAARSPSLIPDLLAAGMNIMRINCAHDGPEDWHLMIRRLREAEQSQGKKCQIYADLAGPKLRTGPIQPIGRVVEIKVKRNLLGQVEKPALVWLTPSEQAEEPNEAVAATLPVGVALLAMAELDDELHVTEARGRTRVLKLIRNEGKSWLAECRQHSYVENDAKCLLLRQGKVVAKGYVTPIPDVFPPIVLHVGDILVLTRGAQMGRHAWYRQGSGELLEPASIPCTLDAVFGSAKPGEPIWLDDGKIGGVIERCAADRIEVRIQQALPQGSKLRAGKGINLPETELEMPALTEVDIQHLDILAKQVDVIGLSFVRTPDDVLNLHRLLDEREASQVGVVLKIETPQAFSNLPMILLASLRRPPVGVMVARGDLAVEIGFERLAEVQEEILWLCEAAHIPVIWATQVLESMAKTGMPSRAEVSDAALAVRAECVMLNKGPYIVDTVRFLSGVLERMSSHRDKTRPMLRRLSVSKILDHEH